MSLLLDALKKAADDKKAAGKASKPVEVAREDGGEEETTGAENHFAVDQTAAIDATTDTNTDDSPVAEVTEEEDELTLSLDEIDPSASEAEDLSADMAAEVDDSTPPSSPQMDTSQSPGSGSGREPSAYSVSDEALALLIDKTNHEVKRDNRLLLMASGLGALLVVIVAGLYYYFDTEEEIAGLQRRHQMTMAQMQARAQGESTPDKTEIIRTLTSDETLASKVEKTKQVIAEKNRARQAHNRMVSAAAAGTAPEKNNANRVLSIEKNRRGDPLETLLQNAWQAYERGDYDTAADGYRQVLKKENTNRDALLGLAAVAQLRNDLQAARDYYLRLLEINPQDANAIAGLSSLQSDAQSLDANESFLQSMLRKNPESDSLNFALANVYAQKDDWQNAQRYYFNAWQLKPDNADYTYNLAVSLDQLGKPRQALRFYRDSLQMAGSSKAGFSTQAVQQRINSLSGAE